MGNVLWEYGGVLSMASWGSWHKDLESWATALTRDALCFFLSISSFFLCVLVSWSSAMGEALFSPALWRRKVNDSFAVFLPIVRKGDSEWPSLGQMTVMTQLTMARNQEHTAQNGSSRGLCELGTCSEEFLERMKLERGETEREKVDSH